MGIVKSREKPRKMHSSRYTSLQRSGTILQYRVGMEGFSLSMQKEGTLQKKNDVPTKR